ncbi:MAG: hypothetical protein B7X86_05090 [Sphingobacteriales bacterium 17-39-43]|uniref:hypothetical protein n=1 Tax=Daejeonella sp. TaxID=2805397 RepID=UPI000BDCEB3B|nr:hypothetical protein [Daejeonella sp.]OYZ32211.1 MAG: hypothetical protein B7Y24_05910 [Sphingobacteriales bacterium 16-39-50]OZA25556.1 MAG: hypothetical protein B7X86_05090 [Sphingobacteriales bacterium 17-39-43]HQT22168.1 hypothetical protein [Daejeonella sp.]HQT57475.1 hypothetical protein [Daejeonella sp.]
MFLNPIVADTGLWLRPVGMSAKRGLAFKYVELTFSTDTELNYSIDMNLNSFYKINGIKKTGLNKTGFPFF